MITIMYEFHFILFQFAVSPADFIIQSNADDSHTFSIEYRHPEAPLVVEKITNFQEKPLVDIPSEKLHKVYKP